MLSRSFCVHGLMSASVGDANLPPPLSPPPSPVVELDLVDGRVDLLPARRRASSCACDGRSMALVVSQLGDDEVVSSMVCVFAEGLAVMCREARRGPVRSLGEAQVERRSYVRRCGTLRSGVCAWSEESTEAGASERLHLESIKFSVYSISSAKTKMVAITEITRARAAAEHAYKAIAHPAWHTPLTTSINAMLPCTSYATLYGQEQLLAPVLIIRPRASS